MKLLSIILFVTMSFSINSFSAAGESRCHKRSYDEATATDASQTQLESISDIKSKISRLEKNIKDEEGDLQFQLNQIYKFEKKQGTEYVFNKISVIDYTAPVMIRVPNYASCKVSEAKLDIEKIKKTLKRLREQKAELEAKLSIRKSIDEILSLMSQAQKKRKNLRKEHQFKETQKAAINALCSLKGK